MIPLEFQKLQITDLLLLTQYKQVTSTLNKLQFGTVIIKAYGKSLRPTLCSELSAQRSKYQLNLPLYVQIASVIQYLLSL